MAIGIRLDGGGSTLHSPGRPAGHGPNFVKQYMGKKNRTERAAPNDAPRCAGQHHTFTQKFAYSPNLSAAQFRTWRGILQLESERIRGGF